MIDNEEAQSRQARLCLKTGSGFKRLIFPLTVPMYIGSSIDDTTNIACFAVFVGRKNARSRADDGVFRKSLVIGVLLGVCPMLTCGAGKGFGVSYWIGSYQIASSADPYQGGVFVLNTKTGQVWMYKLNKWSDLGHISGIEEVKPKLKAVYRESRVSFERR